MEQACQAAERRRARSIPMRAGTAVLAAFIGGSAAAQTVDAYPRAAAAASALHGAQALTEALETPASAEIVHALGGTQADEWTVWIAGNMFSAIGALAAADHEWQRVAVLARASADADTLSDALAQRVEIALSQGNYALCEELADSLARLAEETGDKTDAANQTRVSFVGSPAIIKGQIEEFVSATRADELIAVAHIYDHAARLHSYELASQL